MSDLKFSLPLRIIALPESIQVIDRAERVIFYVYVYEDRDRRNVMKQRAANRFARRMNISSGFCSSDNFDRDL